MQVHATTVLQFCSDSTHKKVTACIGSILVVLALVGPHQQYALPELIARERVQSHVSKVAPQHCHRAELYQRRQGCKHHAIHQISTTGGQTDKQTGKWQDIPADRGSHVWQLLVFL